MRKIKLSTALGRKLYTRGHHWDANTLDQIYDRYSDAKRRAYDRCYNQYLESENHDAFCIISHNSFGFSVSWLCTIDGVDGLRIETPYNSYFVEFDCEYK